MALGKFIKYAATTVAEILEMILPILHVLLWIGAQS